LRKALLARGEVAEWFKAAVLKAGGPCRRLRGNGEALQPVSGSPIRLAGSPV